MTIIVVIRHFLRSFKCVGRTIGNDILFRRRKRVSREILVDMLVIAALDIFFPLDGLIDTGRALAARRTCR